jgi:hypothetical protein
VDEHEGELVSASLSEWRASAEYGQYGCMAKRKITVTADEELVDLAHAFGEEKLSAVVSTALAEHVDRLGRLATLRQLLARWEVQAGPVPPELCADAAAAFDEAGDSPSMAAG